MHSWIRSSVRWLRGERREFGRLSQHRVRYVNSQYAVAVKAARKLGTTPEELLDYRHADRILGGRR